ncbi:hypothetical protein Q4601_07715 [Shewanella sp. 1_MG-2023]|uniref:hypothetical protein n=1 Tax=unclassified Shewanella TaxID=196818 RepID=UPI0026E17D0E|nr:MULTISPECIES: hypothetical protein [unclassified Shewanella]MDO6612079.1 hypothetical protein [Shewanella sp. 7_MG-2023]MDO6771845.1 hypothetical protein [Shewanella sp. 2_MG-2023]MDO6794189.1 hypothetical protein [Shewanella sp. 1_MG-2023]
MLVVTNYPQVPIATSNVATDLARADNQQAKPILPPQELSKAHQERAYNQQNERLTRHELIEQKQQQKQSTEQQLTQQQSQQQALGPKGIFPQLLRVAANSNPTIQRRDIQQKNASSAPVEVDKSAKQDNNRTIQSLLLNEANKEQSDAFYQQLGERVGKFYQQQTTPSDHNQLFALV